MRMSRWLWPVAASFLLMGCGDDTGTTDPSGSGGDGGSTTGGAGGTGGAPPETVNIPDAVINLTVDVNRDGVIDHAADDAGETDAMTNAAGALFLPNLDDDNNDRVRDADDLVAGNDADAMDLAPLHLEAFPTAPDGTTATITLDGVGAEYVRIWFNNGGTWELVAGMMGSCFATDEEPEPDCTISTTGTISNTEAIKAGAQLAIEGRDFVRDLETWNGSVTISVMMHDGNGSQIVSDAIPDGTDSVVSNVSRWMLLGNLSPHDRWWSSFADPGFVQGIKDALPGVEAVNYNNYSDQWTQDFFQTGWTAIPTENGLHGMQIANARPWSQGNVTPYRWLEVSYLGPDSGIIATYNVYNTGTTHDSHGNHDLIPPYDNGTNAYPLGRILIGSGVLPETKEFYNAQEVQGPYFSIYTDWLLVAHVDEVFSYVPAATPRGWKLLVSSPTRAMDMLQDLIDDGYGANIMFQGKNWLEFTNEGAVEVPADISVLDSMEASPGVASDYVTWSQEAQLEIDEILADMMEEIGLQASDVVEVPNLFWEIQGYKVAYQPGTVNALVVGDTIVHPDPFGPLVNNVDPFKLDLETRLGTAINGLGADGQGLNVTFTDDWDVYHRLDGEVHCGTNPDAVAPFDANLWWENWQ